MRFFTLDWHCHTTSCDNVISCDKSPSHTTGPATTDKCSITDKNHIKWKENNQSNSWVRFQNVKKWGWNKFRFLLMFDLMFFYLQKAQEIILTSNILTRFVTIFWRNWTLTEKQLIYDKYGVIYIPCPCVFWPNWHNFGKTVLKCCICCQLPSR